MPETKEQRTAARKRWIEKHPDSYRENYNRQNKKRSDANAILKLERQRKKYEALLENVKTKQSEYEIIPKS